MGARRARDRRCRARRQPVVLVRWSTRTSTRIEKLDPDLNSVCYLDAAARARARRRHRRRGARRRRPRAAGGRAHRREGARVGRGLAGDARVGRARRSGRGDRRQRGVAPPRRRRGDHRPHDRVGARHRELHEHAAARRHPQPVEPRAHARRLVGRLGRRGRGGPVPGLHRRRRRRLDPHPVLVLRAVRHEGHVRPHRARSRSVQLVAEPGARADGALRARRRPLPRRHVGPHAHRPDVAAGTGRAVRGGAALRCRGRAAARQARRVHVHRRASPAPIPSSPSTPRIWRTR